MLENRNLTKGLGKIMKSLGIIGCGVHAQHHAKQCGSHFIIGGVWDPNSDAMHQIVSGKKYLNMEAMLADDQIDAIMICSPDQFHLMQIEASLLSHKHVFCEKPLLVPGEDIGKLNSMFDFAVSENLVLTSCHVRRFDRPFMWLINHMHKGGSDVFLPDRFGKVIGLEFDFSYHKPSNAWKHTRSLLLDHLNHEVDLMNALFGIMGFNAWKISDGFDQYEVVGCRDDGISFHFRGTRRLNTHIYPEWCRVRFERGEVILDMMTGVASIHDHDTKSVEILPNLHIDYDGRLNRVIGNFSDCIDGICSNYLTRAEMIMNTESGIILQNEGLQRIDIL